jgi:hypothetical protein
VSWAVLQFNKHIVLAVALLVVVAAAEGGAPGTTQAVWQFAACALQIIIQVVAVDVCANRIFGSAKALPGAAPIAATVRRIAKSLA